MNNFYIGVIGPVSGLSENQTTPIRAEVRDALKVAKEVTLYVWRDTSNRHPVNKNPDKMLLMEQFLLHGISQASVSWLEFEQVPTISYSGPLLRACDLLMFCPAEHATTAKSRVNTLRKFAESLSLRLRITQAWRSETN